jgi:hypothetical protein
MIPGKKKRIDMILLPIRYNFFLRSSIGRKKEVKRARAGVV